MPPVAVRLVSAAPQCHVLVIGDIMLDVYITGSADRISPESPVPVVSVKTRRFVPGGAANVASNARALGARVTLSGVVGEDHSAHYLLEQLELRDISYSAVVRDPSRPTTTKTRITAIRQQIVRFDEEETGPFSPVVRAALLASCREAMQTADVCILSDYSKGIFDIRFCAEVIVLANTRGIPIAIDPKSNDFSRYRGASVVTPNLKEAAEAAGYPIRTSSDLEAAAVQLLAQIHPASLLITRGEEGMTLFSEKKMHHFPALVNEVADVTGAGDTVISALAVCLAVGIPLDEAAELANQTAAIAVSHPGTWAVTAAELLDATR